MLVLLVIVLTTATFVAKGVIPVDLPDASSQAKEVEKEDLIITIKSGGELFIDEKPLTKKQFLQKLKTYDRKKPVIINSDKQTRFEHFVYVLDNLKLGGFNNVGVLSQNE